jgi:GTP cyclohydrolase III
VIGITFSLAGIGFSDCLLAIQIKPYFLISRLQFKQNRTMVLYIAIDGDDIGRKLEYYTVANQMENLSMFFNAYKTSMTWLEKELILNLNAEIIINGGDSLLAFCYKNETQVFDELEEIRNEFFQLSKTTLSVGLGSVPRQAYFALKLAKASGKDRIEIFREC